MVLLARRAYLVLLSGHSHSTSVCQHSLHIQSFFLRIHDIGIHSCMYMYIRMYVKTTFFPSMIDVSTWNYEDVKECHPMNGNDAVNTFGSKHGQHGTDEGE